MENMDPENHKLITLSKKANFYIVSLCIDTVMCSNYYRSYTSSYLYDDNNVAGQRHLNML